MIPVIVWSNLERFYVHLKHVDFNIFCMINLQNSSDFRNNDFRDKLQYFKSRISLIITKTVSMSENSIFTDFATNLHAILF